MPKYLDDVFRALADPSRRQMLERLASGPATVSELARPLPMSLPSAVQHLHILQGSGLVRSTKTGRVRTCELNRNALEDAETWFADQRRRWERRLNSLEDFLSPLNNEQEK